MLDWCAIQKDEDLWILDHQPGIVEDIRLKYVTASTVSSTSFSVFSLAALSLYTVCQQWPNS